MDVQRVQKSSVHNLKGKADIPQESVSFQNVMSKQRSSVTVDRLSKKMTEIQEQGKKLTENQTIDNLRKYKKMIKEFLDDAVKNGLELEQHRGFNRRGTTKIYKLVKEVDKKVMELTDAVISKEQKGLSTLSLVGEIEGMLINIYT